jgi:hypothetical protein
MLATKSLKKRLWHWCLSDLISSAGASHVGKDPAITGITCPAFFALFLFDPSDCPESGDPSFGWRHVLRWLAARPRRQAGQAEQRTLLRFRDSF